MRERYREDKKGERYKEDKERDTERTEKEIQRGQRGR